MTIINKLREKADFCVLNPLQNRIRWSDGKQEEVSYAQLVSLKEQHPNWMFEEFEEFKHA